MPQVPGGSSDPAVLIYALPRCSPGEALDGAFPLHQPPTTLFVALPPPDTVLTPLAQPGLLMVLT